MASALAQVTRPGRPCIADRVRGRGAAGDIMIIPPNVPHEFTYLEDTIDIDIFAPGRQDWLDGTAIYLS
jgi:hypothetical protein